jgi:hypothetical protein
MPIGRFYFGNWNLLVGSEFAVLAKSELFLAQQQQVPDLHQILCLMKIQSEKCSSWTMEASA